MMLYNRRWFLIKNNDMIERFNEFGILFVSTMILSMLTITDGVILYQFGLLMNYTMLSIFALNILYVAVHIVGGLIDSCKNRCQ